MKMRRRMGMNHKQSLLLRRTQRKSRVHQGFRRLRKPLGGMGLALAATLVLVPGFRYLWSHTPLSSFFRVRGVSVEGNALLDTSLVLRTASVGAPSPILSLSEKAVAQKLQTLSWVKEAKVERGMNRQVTLKIKEREPVAWVSLESSSGDPISVMLADTEGNLLPPVDGRLFSLPLVRGCRSDTGAVPRVRPDSVWILSLRLLREVQRIAPDLLAEVSEIAYAQDRFDLLTIGGTHIRLPGAFLPVHARKLSAVMDRLIRTAAQAETIDLCYERVAYVRLRHENNRPNGTTAEPLTERN